jgi:uncharacterized membrane protein
MRTWVFRLLGWPGVFLAVCIAAAAVFLVLPWSVEGKSLALLHGLCAQQPTHSLYFGDQRLPFDSRMTGIYGGFAVATLTLLARGRWRFAGIPPLRIILVLVAFIALMGIDGINSTLVDLRLWHLYTPHNELRLATGILTGVALGVFVWMLVCQIGFARRARRNRPPVAGVRDLGWVLLVGLGYGLLVLTRWSPLRIPLTLLLIISALTAVTGLALGFVLLLSGRESVATDTWQLAGPATAALVIAMVVIGMLGGGRFLLEAWLGLSAQLQGAV